MGVDVFQRVVRTDAAGNAQGVAPGLAEERYNLYSITPFLPVERGQQVCGGVCWCDEQWVPEV